MVTYSKLEFCWALSQFSEQYTIQLCVLEKPALCYQSFTYCSKDVVYIDQGMDGEAVSLAFATTAGPDCLKDVISKYGIRLKVY